MTLSISEYLQSADIQNDSLRYEWDDWKTLPALEALDDQLVARLKRVTQRAVLAFACATAEWIVYRFERLCPDREPWDYLEAAWAMIVDVRYCGFGDTATTWQEYSQRQWNGPIRRPIHDALKTLEIAFQQLSSEYRTDPAVDAAVNHTLACYVMSDPLPYKTWCERVLDRFEALYPRRPEDERGDVVPRLAADLNFDFRFEDTERLTNEFLRSLDHRSNIFLSPPEGMLQHFEDEENFEGTPYLFSLEADRRARGSTRA
jgi:hypothetical protein